ncbi:hypothetical protein [Mumia zhuanghuii]|nr:hypothetical protein [Mumia zhuanghuii]
MLLLGLTVERVLDDHGRKWFVRYVAMVGHYRLWELLEKRQTLRPLPA